MGRNREVIEARTAYWMEIAENYAKERYSGRNPEHISLALNLFKQPTYGYYQVVASLGDRQAIKEQIDTDIEDLSKSILIIKKLGTMLGSNGWDVEDLQNSMAFLFSGSPMIRGIFDKELGKLNHDQDIFNDRLDFIQDISQYIEDLPDTSEE
jgi:hypothetical protein